MLQIQTNLTLIKEWHKNLKANKTALTDSETAKIKSGEAILKQVKQGNGGRGIAVMDINASQEKV